MEKITKRCKDCWWAHETTEKCMVMCWWFHEEVYALSMPCHEFAEKCPIF